MPKTIYNYDANTKAYIGSSLADSDPLRAGEYLIPANSTETQPPSAEDGKYVAYIDDAWVQVVIPGEPEPTLEERRAAMSVSAFQAIAALKRNNQYDAVEAVILDAETPEETQLAFERATTFTRNGDLIAFLETNVPFTPTELDDLFELAITIEA